MSNVILVEEKFTLFHQYLRHCLKSVIIVVSVRGATLRGKSHIFNMVSARVCLFGHVIHAGSADHLKNK